MKFSKEIFTLVFVTNKTILKKTPCLIIRKSKSSRTHVLSNILF